MNPPDLSFIRFLVFGLPLVLAIAWALRQVFEERGDRFQ